MDSNRKPALPLPDKKIPFVVMLIGTFELAVALLGLIILVLVGQLNGQGIALLVLLGIYGAMGAGLWAIQEWARVVNVILHILIVPYIMYTLPFWENQFWQPIVQLMISFLIITALTRPVIRHKFQTVVSKNRH